jgi:AcrR family transcriptional regulator
MRIKPRTAPRKSPKQERSRSTIEAILTATARVLVKEGFDKASTNRIAEQAGVSIGSLYQYFPSKEALVAALIERHTDEMTAVLTAAFDRVARLPVAQAARELVALMLEAHSIDPALHRVLIEQVPRVGRLSRIHEVESRAEEMVRAYLTLHREELRVSDLDSAAFLMVSTVEALTHAAVIYYPERLKSGALAGEITEMVVRYLLR